MRPAARAGLLALAAFLAAAPALGQLPTQNPPPPPDCPPDLSDPQAPVADAGADQNGPPFTNAANQPLNNLPQATEGTVVRLDAGETCDPQGDEVFFQWQQVDGPPVELSSDTAVSPTFRAPHVPKGYVPPGGSGMANILLQFRLVANDGHNFSRPDDVVVVVNGRPVADAGPDLIVEDGRIDPVTGALVPNNVTLNGDGSYDPVGEAILWSWTQRSGIPVATGSTIADHLEFEAPALADGQPRDLRFELTVVDVEGGFRKAVSLPDSVLVRVVPFNPAPFVCCVVASLDTVDIVQNSGETLRFGLVATDPNGEIHSAYAVLEATAAKARIEVPLFPEDPSSPDNQVFLGSLPVDDPRLVLNVGSSGATQSWTVRGVAYDDDGKPGFTGSDETLFLTVFATGVQGAFPTLRIIGSGPEPASPPCPPTPSSVPTRILGPGDSVRFGVCINPFLLLSRVTYQSQFDQEGPIDLTGDEITLAAPYVLDTDALSGGEQTLIVRAYDRLGHVERLDVPVIVDLGPPEVFLVAPETAYADLPATILAFVHDDADKEATLRFANTTQTLAWPGENVTALVRLNASTAPIVAAQLVSLLPPQMIYPLLDDDDDGGLEAFLAAAPTRMYRFQVTPDRVASFLFTATVRDAAGNQAIENGLLRAEQAFTDLELQAVTVANDRVLPGEGVLFSASLRQKTGVTTVPANVTFRVGPAAVSEEVDVPLATSVVVGPINQTFPPGAHVVEATATGPTGVAEQDPANQRRSDTFEVFLGQTVYVVGAEERLYWIRANSQGLPLEAVPDGGGSAHALLLNQTGDTLRYEFRAGGETLWWDPLERDEDGRPVTTLRPAPRDDSNDSPVPLAAPLCALALAALAWRRRRA